MPANGWTNPSPEKIPGTDVIQTPILPYEFSSRCLRFSYADPVLPYPWIYPGLSRSYNFLTTLCSFSNCSTTYRIISEGMLLSIDKRFSLFSMFPKNSSSIVTFRFPSCFSISNNSVLSIIILDSQKFTDLKISYSPDDPHAMARLNPSSPPASPSSTSSLPQSLKAWTEQKSWQSCGSLLFILPSPR